MIKPKVSMVTPCYNGEKHLVYFLESLLEQDYLNVEFFFVDDGSTDGTKEIFDSYILKLEEKGWDVKYIYKENGGAASAINAALPLISGKYFTWVDSDDILYKNNISEKVKYMEEHPEFAVAYSPYDVAKYSDIEKIVKQGDFIAKRSMFYRVLNEDLIIWSLTTIAKTDALFDVIPDKKIPECQGGQNCQILMPLFYKYKCGRINKILARCIIRPNSHSRTNNKNFIRRRLQMTEIWIRTIETLRYASKFEKFCFIAFVLLRNLIAILKHYLSKIFSVKIKAKHIKIRFLGFKIKFKRAVKNSN